MGIYTKVLLDRESLYKCLSLSFNDQHAFQSNKRLILLDFTEVAMLAISCMKSEMTRLIPPVLFYGCQGSQIQSEAGCHG